MPDQSLPNLAFQPYIQAPDLAPTDMYGNLLQQSQQRYDDNLAKSDALDEHISQLGTTINSVDQPILDSLNSDTRSALTNIKTNGNWEDADVPIRQIAKRLLSDPALTIAQQNKQESDRIDAIKNDMAAKGKDTIQFHDYKNIPTQNPDGTFNRISSMDVMPQEKLDYDTKMRQMFEGVNPDSHASSTSTPIQDTDTNSVYQTANGYSYRGISGTKIGQIAKQLLPEYLNTDEGSQRYKVLTTVNDHNSNPLTDQQARDQIQHELLETGLTKVFSDTSTSSSEKLQKPTKVPDTTPYPGTQLMADVAQPETADFSSWQDALDKKPRQKFDPVKSQQLVNNTNSDQLIAFSDTKPAYGDIPEQYQQANSTLFNYFSKIAKTTDPDKINPMIKSYLQANQNQMLTPMVHVFADKKLIEAQNAPIQNGAVNMYPLQDSQHRVYTSTQDPTFKSDHPESFDKDGNLKEAKMVGYYDENNPYSELAGSKGSQFIAPKKLSIGNESFVAGSVPQDTRSPDYLSKYLGTKISLSNRLGGKLPVTFYNPDSPEDKIQVLASKVTLPDGSQGDGYIITGKDKTGKSVILQANDLNAAKTILNRNNYTKTDQ